MQAAKQDRATAERDQQNVLAADIREFDSGRPQLERYHPNEFALCFRGQYIGVFPDFESAAKVAI